MTMTWHRSTRALDPWWTRCRRVLATFGPLSGSGQGLIGCLQRRLRLLQCCHPHEALKENAVRVGDDGKGDDPPVDSDGDGVTIGAAALGLVQFSGDAGE